MVSAQEQVATTRLSYWQVFRLIFVMFSLYLMGDAFYRWDGFRYYGTLSEFVPAVALITVFWTTLAVFAALMVWLIGKAVEWFCRHMGWNVKIEHLLLFISIFILLGAAAWLGKRLIWQHTPTTIQLKVIIFLSVTFTVIFLTWLFRNKMPVIQERITPLVWLFGIWFILSVPLVAYHTWWKQTDNVVSEKIFKTSVGDKSRPNIILVIFDALTTQDMSAYGYYRPTTPFINEWAKEASLFTRAEAESNWTTPTIPSLMTGKRVWTHQTYYCVEGPNPVGDNIESLPLLLKNDGYYNMAFVVNHFASVEILGMSKSFHIAESPIAFYSDTKSLVKIIWVSLYRLFGNKIWLYDWIIKEDFIMNRLLHVVSDFSKTEVPPEKAFNEFLAAIDNNPPEPFFAWIHLFPPHHPYLPPEPYMGMFDSSPEMRTFKSQQSVPVQEFAMEEQARVNILRARYDEFIRYSDKQFEDFIAQLVDRNKLKNTVIILSSDHGESFEHNYQKHIGPHLYEQLTHIPLIIKESNQTEGRIINDLIEQIDIPATILDLANIPVPSWMEGRSLVPLMRGKRLSSRPAFSMALHKNPPRHQITKGTIAVWEGDYKLIHYLEEKKSLLFNLKQDPDELNNLFDKEPEVGQRLLNMIQDNLKRANEKIRRGE